MSLTARSHGLGALAPGGQTFSSIAGSSDSPIIAADRDCIYAAVDATRAIVALGAVLAGEFGGRLSISARGALAGSVLQVEVDAIVTFDAPEAIVGRVRHTFAGFAPSRAGVGQQGTASCSQGICRKDTRAGRQADV